jgi:hypothetical protein
MALQKKLQEEQSRYYYKKILKQDKNVLIMDLLLQGLHIKNVWNHKE